MNDDDAYNLRLHCLHETAMRTPDDIHFNLLSPTQFEELCFDLLMELGFRKLIWRQGGSDSGRDIQGTREVISGLLEPFEETWFFECKHYHSGVSPEALNSKIAWADAERPKHLVFFISSYITNNARTWLATIARDKFYRVHLIEGKQLQHLVSRSQILRSRYFSTEMQQLMQQAHRAWVMHYLIPEPDLLDTLARTKCLAEYDLGQLAFLWASLMIRFEQMDSSERYYWCDSHDIMFSMLMQQSNTGTPVLLSSKYGWYWEETMAHEGGADCDVLYNKVYASQIFTINDSMREYCALYALVRNEEGEGIEVLVSHNSSLTAYIRYIPKGAELALLAAKKILHS